MFLRRLLLIAFVVFVQFEAAGTLKFPGYDFSHCSGLLANLGDHWIREYKLLPDLTKGKNVPELVRRQVLMTYVKAVEERRVAGAIGVLDAVLISMGIRSSDRPEDVSEGMFLTLYEEIAEGHNSLLSDMRTLLGIPGERLFPGVAPASYATLYALTERPHLQTLLSFPGYEEASARGRLLEYLRLGPSLETLSQLRFQFFRALLGNMPLTQPFEPEPEEAARFYSLAMSRSGVAGRVTTDAAVRRAFFNRGRALCNSGNLPKFPAEELRRHMEFLDQFELGVDPAFVALLQQLEDSVD